MHLEYRNVNEAFRVLTESIHKGYIDTKASPSRYGDVLRMKEPVTITYTHPRERVLFNTVRDGNPFFHLFESLWMLAGRNDLAPIVYYNARMAEFSDDGGVTQPDAYGYRWRQHFDWDQLPPIIAELKKDNTSRRVVLQMWDAGVISDQWLGLDFYRATHGGKGVPCNVCAMFDIVDGNLDMTVINRSNDLIWGTLGANVVHFSFLQEYLACCIGVEVGVYNQFSNNQHVYTAPERWKPEEWLSYYNSFTQVSYADSLEDQTVHGGVLPGMKLVQDQHTFDIEVKQFIDSWYHEWKEPFLNYVAKPMCAAFSHHKARQYDLAREAMTRVMAQDWQEAGIMWLLEREAKWKAKKENADAR